MSQTQETPALPDPATLTATLQTYLDAARTRLCGSDGSKTEHNVDIEAFFATVSAELSPPLVRHFLVRVGLLQALRGGVWRVRLVEPVQQRLVERVIATGDLPMPVAPAVASEPSPAGDGEIARLRQLNASLRADNDGLREVVAAQLELITRMTQAVLDK